MGRAETGYTPVVPWSDYVATAKDAAETTGALFIDLNPRVPNTPSNPDIYVVVGVETAPPTDKGHQLIAGVIVGRLKRKWGTAPSTDVASNQPEKLIVGKVYRPAVAKTHTTTATSNTIIDGGTLNLALFVSLPASGNTLCADSPPKWTHQEPLECGRQ